MYLSAAFRLSIFGEGSGRFRFPTLCRPAHDRFDQTTLGAADFPSHLAHLLQCLAPVLSPSPSPQPSNDQDAAIPHVSFERLKAPKESPKAASEILGWKLLKTYIVESSRFSHPVEGLVEKIQTYVASGGVE